jgi:probable F420-dependent oxidoreductase
LPYSSNLLSSYVLPGRAPDPRAGIAQARAAERIGLGSVFVSERHESKETGSMMGALSQVTSRVNLAAGLTHFGTRHPLVLAGLGATMQYLSGNRFVLGFGRSVPKVFKMWGAPVYNNAGMADYALILRRLWAGERVSYNGPVGNFPQMQLAQVPERPPPILLGAVGPKTLALGGQHFDGVILHPFLTVEAVASSCRVIREAAKEAGRDPHTLRIFACVVVAPDTLSPAEKADAVDARAVSYFAHRELGTPILERNGWDEGPMNRLIESGASQLELQQADHDQIRRTLARAVEMLPAQWLTTGAAVGSTRHCAERLKEYLAAGADEILLHGITPDKQEALVKEFCAS